MHGDTTASVWKQTSDEFPKVLYRDVDVSNDDRKRKMSNFMGVQTVSRFHFKRGETFVKRGKTGGKDPSTSFFQKDVFISSIGSTSKHCRNFGGNAEGGKNNTESFTTTAVK